ncbi:DUF1624 domain-containing protein [Lysobacter sp.]|uniref:DUF1624 domain-containing protein n=1 Tax=Lysobacter sp. TaxID=72226 RepID=UPI0039C95735
MTSTATQPNGGRLASIDLLRGVVMLVMLLDHVRETFYLHRQVGDPMDVTQVEPALFVSRVLAHLCAPVFVFLTGLSAWLYGSRQPRPREAASAFLFKRGLFLIVLELTLVNFAWTGRFPPDVIYLQVIWAIGLSMVALSALLWLPRAALVTFGILVIAAHNLLDGVQATPGTAWDALWSVLHERNWIELGDLRLRTSYPVLPWIGVIALGYAAGPWYGANMSTAARQTRLLIAGVLALSAFVVLRWIDVYGDAPRLSGGGALMDAMSFFNVTKYPPSLLFLLLTVGVGLWLLRLFENPRLAQALAPLVTFGAAPMFFYLLHLYVLKLLYVLAERLIGRTDGGVFSLPDVASLWLAAALVALLLYVPVRWFAALKARRRDLAWLRYL